MQVTIDKICRLDGTRFVVSVGEAVRSIIRSTPYPIGDKYAKSIEHELRCGNELATHGYIYRVTPPVYAAAPELLAACKMALDGLDEGLINGSEQTVIALRSAIAKATRVQS